MFQEVQTGVDESGNPIYTMEPVYTTVTTTTTVPVYTTEPVFTTEPVYTEEPVYVTGITGTAVEQASTAHTQDQWFAYDSMNRQILVDGAVDGNAANLANITPGQGHVLSYDKNGNRIEDRSWGTQVVPEYVQNFDESGQTLGAPVLSGYSSQAGIQTQWYTYDSMNRLATVATGAYGQVQTGVDAGGNAVYTVEALGEDQAIVLDRRVYDAASRVLSSGPGGSLPAAYVSALVGSDTDLSGATTTTTQYDADQVLTQHVVNEANASVSDTVYGAYDAAGNLRGYQTTTSGGGADTVTTQFTIATQKLDGYKEQSVTALATNQSSGNTTSGITTDVYDANGMLAGVDSTVNGAPDAANTRTFVNDAQGHVLQKDQQNHLLHELVVNGNVMGSYGMGVDPDTPLNGDGSPNYTVQGNFDLAYAPVTNSYPAATTGQYPVQSGDTLQSIAQAAYGDSSLWYQIANANGLSGNQDLRVGQVLNIPTRVGATHNTASTYAPYDPSKIVGATSPNLPTPAGNADSGGCGGLGEIITTVIAAVVAVVVTAYTEDPDAGELTFQQLVAAAGSASPGAAATGAAVGDVAAQVVGNVIGTRDGFSFKEVALSALSAGVTQGVTQSGLLPSAGNATADAAARAAVSNALTQSAEVAVGLQQHFSWTDVAASAVGAGVGSAINGSIGSSFDGLGPVGSRVAAASVTGLAAGIATSIARGGRVDVQQVATDAFGNALGSSLAAASVSGTNAGSSGYDYSNAPDESAAEMARLNGYEAIAAVNAQQQADFDQIVGAFGQTDQIDRSGDVQLAANGSYARVDPGSVESLRGDDGVYRVEIRGTSTTPDRYGAGGMSYSPGSANDVAGLEALDAQAAQSDAPDYYLAPQAEGGVGRDTPQAHVVITGNRAELLAQLDAEQDQFDAMGNFVGAQTSADGTSFGQTPYAASIGQAFNFIGNIGLGAAEIAGKGFVSQAVRIGSGLASIPDALAGGVDAAVGLQQSIQDSLRVTPSSIGARMIGQALAPVGQAIGGFANSVHGVSEQYLGDGVTSALGATLQAGTAIAGIFGAGRLVQGALEEGVAGIGNVGNASKLIPGFTETETGIINEAQGILGSQELGAVRAAHEAGQPLTVTVNGRLIQYEPGLPASGMTMFGENGFLIGNEAFTSEAELQQTVLHELHRLTTSASSDGVSGALASQETQAAFDFAARAVKHLNGGPN